MNLLPSAKAHQFLQKIHVESSYPNHIAQGPIIYAPMPTVCQYRNRLNTPENCPRKRRSTSQNRSLSPTSQESSTLDPRCAPYAQAANKHMKEMTEIMGGRSTSQRTFSDAQENHGNAMNALVECVRRNH